MNHASRPFVVLKDNELFTRTQIAVASLVGSPWAGFLCLGYNLYHDDSDPDFKRLKFLFYIIIAYGVWLLLDIETDQILESHMPDLLALVNTPVSSLLQLFAPDISDAVYGVESRFSSAWLFPLFFILAWIFLFPQYNNWQSQSLQAGSWWSIVIGIAVGRLISSLVWVLVEYA